VALATGACSGVSVNQPFDTSLINFRRTLMLDATPQPPLAEDQAQALVSAIESGMLRSPYLDSSISRAQFHERFDGNFKLRDDYSLLSDTLSVVGLADREQTARIGRLTDVEMLLGAQVFSVPCENCPESDQVAAVGQMIDAKSGQLVWRVTLLKSVNRNPAAVEQALRELSAELLEHFNNSLRPKWQRERFKNLGPGLANRPRASIPLPGMERGPRIEPGRSVPAQSP
jgi:hypothetical protein